MSIEAGLRVLVVEDDEAAAELTRRTLTRTGFKVMVVGTLAAAHESLRDTWFDVVLLDYNLPDGKPWALVESARTRTPRIPVVLVTAAGSEPIVAEALQRGVGDYIRKAPNYLFDLSQVLQRVIKLAQAEEELRQSGALFKLISDHGEDMILTLDGQGVIQYVSTACRRLLGHEMTDLLGTRIHELLHPDDDGVSIFQLESANQTFAAHCEIYRLRHRDGHHVWVESNLQHVAGTDLTSGRRIIGITRDISARMAAQQKIEAALLEKTVLLNEVHHRVKNNLQIIVSLLKLQREHSKEAEVHAALTGSESRIRAMSLIHQFLYEQKNFARLDLTAYLRQLGALVESVHHGRDRGVELRVRGPATPVWLGFDQAVPCGLLVNELLTNAFKHAFPGPRPGRIVLDLYADDAMELSLSVHDDGVGLPRDFNIAQPATLGLQLVSVLTRQLHGRWRVDPAVQGARFDIDFPARERRLRAVA